MDVAARLPTRARAQSYLERERAGMQDDSEAESESNLVRRKVPRTTTDPVVHPGLTSSTPSTEHPAFRKPALPASATRPAGVERTGSITHRRRTSLRDNVRLPSGPRDFPGATTTRRLPSFGSTAPAVGQPASKPSPSSTHATPRSFMSSIKTDSSLPSLQMQTRLEPGSTSKYADDGLSPTKQSDHFDFLPDINFDDFQTSIRDYDGSTSLLGEFPAAGMSWGMTAREAQEGGRANGNNASLSSDRTWGETARETAQGQKKPSDLGRTQSLRQRLAGARQASGEHAAATAKERQSGQPSLLSLRDRRQSSVASTSMNPATTGSGQVPSPAAAASKPPRKSVGPGLIAGMIRGGGERQSSIGSIGSNGGQLASSVSRKSSISKARRTTMQPTMPSSSELPRVSSLAPTMQSRANKVKSLQPPPRDEPDPGTPLSSQKGSKSNQARSQTPSSSGNRRQSMAASGRASGLGARTISPTDARRIKRMSTVNAPPIPSTAIKGPLSPQDEPVNPLSTARFPDMPRPAQPSPSLIPRRAGNMTPSSARASPDGRSSHAAGGVSLTTKSSFSSLVNASINGSASRLPTPKARPATQSSSSLAQYSDQFSEPENDEHVPPVPAIPKAYGSPRDAEAPTLFPSSLKSPLSAPLDTASFEPSLDVNSISAPFASRSPRSSMEIAAAVSPVKRSIDLSRPGHRRTLTAGSGSASFANDASASTAPPRSARLPSESNGRTNVNLQPLRLPPLNMMPINTNYVRQSSLSVMPHPSKEVDNREDYTSMQTPEPKGVPKTPSTPMTASKAQYLRRQDEKTKALRSSSSHYALRDVLGMDENGNLTTKYWDDNDIEFSTGVPVPNGQNKQRNAVTPFSSGSLPKTSGEFSRVRGLPSGEYEDEYSLGHYQNLQLQSSKPRGPRLRAQTGGTISSLNSNAPQTPSSIESPVIESQAKKEGSDKKDKEPGSAGGLRRKLSLGWRRSSSSKGAASHPDNKNSPHQSHEAPVKEKDKPLPKSTQKSADMPPPKLPASATWSNDLPMLSSSGRPSLDGGSRRKSHIPPLSSGGFSTSDMPSLSTASTVSSGAGSSAIKTRSQHSEQPQPVVSLPAGTRASSWGNVTDQQITTSTRPATSSRVPSLSTTKSKATTTSKSHSISALVKDKDDLVADDEMQRLSRKRKDVDSAAHESEQLKKRAIARDVMSAEQVLHDRSLFGGSGLNVFERGEIVDYEKDGIYFTGTQAASKIVGALNPSLSASNALGSDGKDGKAGGSGNNFGYDDERGDYNIVLGDHLAYRYEVVDVLGKGSFGQVVRCVDHKHGGVVAVKIIRNKKRFHQQALVEVGILGKLREWDPDGTHATLSITGSFYFRSHLCIVTPCLSINLYELIRAHNFVGFQLPLIRRFARQLLACLTLLQSKRIIHCDLKPENILLCEARKADVRVIDFGSSCREEEKVYTYIQSRFYRSPEVILGSSYGLGIDMWSFGCILAELWTGYPLFPGENEQEQLACIMEIFGPPDRHLVERCTRKKVFFDSVGKPRVTVSSKGRRRRPSSKTLQQALKTEDEAFIDFITRCLRWDPDRRMKPADAVKHPFITNQPMPHRAGIPDEARRATRPRPINTTTATASTTSSVPSPVKKSGNAFAQQPGLHSSATHGLALNTPARVDRTKPLLQPQDTSQTALRAAAAGGGVGPSPVKSTPSHGRRQSSVTTATTASAAAANHGLPVAQHRTASGNLAQLAATAATAANGAGGANIGAARWRA